LTFSKIPGRSSGLFENSNQSGAALMLGMILSYAVVPPRLRIPFIVVTGVGILTTFTRSAMLGWIIVVLFLAARNRIDVPALRRALVVALVVVGFVFSPYWGHLQATLEERGSLNLSVIQRLAFFSTGLAGDESASDRKRVAVTAWRMFEARPLAGYGTGASRNIPGFEISTHNVYLANMVDHGIVGLFLLPSLLLATLWGANRRTFEVVGPFVLFMAMWGLFSHNVLEERYILFAVALVASLVHGARTRKVEAPAAQRLPVPSGAVARA
jgi:O-antigen ligase